MRPPPAQVLSLLPGPLRSQLGLLLGNFRRPPSLLPGDLLRFFRLLPSSLRRSLPLPAGQLLGMLGLLTSLLSGPRHIRPSLLSRPLQHGPGGRPQLRSLLDRRPRSPGRPSQRRPLGECLRPTTIPDRQHPPDRGATRGRRGAELGRLGGQRIDRLVGQKPLDRRVPAADPGSDHCAQHNLFHGEPTPENLKKRPAGGGFPSRRPQLWAQGWD